jgi:hypothetical protein
MKTIQEWIRSQKNAIKRRVRQGKVSKAVAQRQLKRLGVA